MPLIIVRNDITKMQVDAIVNAANHTLLGGGGVDGCIHRAAGKELKEECETLGGCETGDAKITKGYHLPCKYVIHTVGPVWQGGNKGEEELLTSCYRRSLELAKEYSCETVAFPLISAGVYGYPKKEAFAIAENTIREFILENEMTVYIVIFDKGSLTAAEAKYPDIKAYIDDRYVGDHADSRNVFLRRKEALKANKADIAEETVREESPVPLFAAMTVPSMSLDERLKQIDESFTEMLLRKIDESGMTDSECYKKANIDRKLFSKIKSDRKYRPSKPTVLAFAIALRLDIEQTHDLLMKAGFALSKSSKADIIVEYFIENGKYDIFTINEALFEFDQPLLGQ